MRALDQEGILFPSDIFSPVLLKVCFSLRFLAQIHTIFLAFYV